MEHKQESLRNIWTGVFFLFKLTLHTKQRPLFFDPRSYIIMTFRSKSSYLYNYLSIIVCLLFKFIATPYYSSVEKP